MRKLFYMGLEPYEERYTLQLQDWSTAVFDKMGIDYEVVPGSLLNNDKSIVTGQVLDAHGRSYFGMSQMMSLVKMMQEGKVTCDDVVYFEDMFQPGITSLPYIMDQVSPKHRPQIFVHCMAQSIDPDDFIHVWNMQRWMGHYEHLVNDFVDGVFCTNEEMVANAKVAGWTAPLYNIAGLAFGKDEVRSRVAYEVRPFEKRTKRVAFSARWDQEKQPDFYMDLIEQFFQHRTAAQLDVEFALFSGGPLRSNNQSYMERTDRLVREGKLKVHDNLSKNRYYELLNDTRVVFNCALQDWTSNTVSEADALGSNVLYPAYRSFPETFANDHTRLYVPWSLNDAIDKLSPLLENPHPFMGAISDWNNGTIERIVHIMTGFGEEWRRDTNDYRKHTRVARYDAEA